MSIETEIAEAVRRVVREELAAQSGIQDIELLTADDVARLLKYEDRHSVYTLRRQGKLEAVSLGVKTIRFRTSEVRRFIAEQNALLNKTPSSIASE